MTKEEIENENLNEAKNPALQQGDVCGSDFWWNAMYANIS